MGHHSTADSYAEPWQANRTLSLELDFAANAGDRLFPLIAALTAPPYYDAAKTYDTLLGSTPALYTEAVEHYRKLVASGVQVETPDDHVNLAYTWARIALDQAYVCNPWLGSGLVAGYGSSRDIRRPQYAWFFGGDALNNSFALEASGTTPSPATPSASSRIIKRRTLAKSSANSRRAPDSSTGSRTILTLIVTPM